MIYKMYSVHYAPKDSRTSIAFFLKAKNDTEVYDLVREQFYWDCKEEDSIDLAQRIIELCGDDDEEVTEFSDLYYGLTTHYWKACPLLTDDDYDVLVKAGMGIKNED